jgi:hypothetical protein
MGLSSRKPEGGIRFWLDPRKRDPSTPVPVWEGVYNGTPNYMDIALYGMMSMSKQNIKSQMQLQKHLTFTEVLQVNRINTNSFTPCLPHNKLRSDRIYFVNSGEIGYVIGYTKFDELDTYRPAEEQQKYNAALIQFEDLKWEPNYYNPNSNVKIKYHRPQYKILTMYDENFILAKECEMLSIDELEEYMKNWESNYDGELLDAPEQSGVLKQ